MHLLTLYSFMQRVDHSSGESPRPALCLAAFAKDNPVPQQERVKVGVRLGGGLAYETQGRVIPQAINGGRVSK